MANPVVPASLENVGETQEIGRNIGTGIVDADAVTDAGLSGKMDDPVELMIGKGGIDRPLIGKIGANEFEIGALGCPKLMKPGQAGFLERRVVVIIDDIESDDTVPALDQAAGDMIADKSGAAGNENFHEKLSTACSCGWAGARPTLI